MSSRLREVSLEPTRTTEAATAFAQDDADAVRAQCVASPISSGPNCRSSRPSSHRVRFAVPAPSSYRFDLPQQSEAGQHQTRV